MKKFRSIKSWFPIKNIENGIIETKSGKYCKILEVFPINFELKTISEKESIIYQYKTFLKTCNFDMQILIQSKRNDLNEHIERVLKTAKNEENDQLIKMINDYIKMIKEKTLKTTITRRFFIIFYTEEKNKSKVLREKIEGELSEKSLKIIKTLEKCGNEVRDLSVDNFTIVNNLYEQLNRKTCEIQKIRVDSYEKNQNKR